MSNRLADDEDDDAFDALLREAFELPSAPEPGEGQSVLRCVKCGATGRAPLSACPLDGGTMVATGDNRIGQLVGPYRVLECLGRGGNGSVYRARHRTLGAEAAVKFLRPELAQTAEHRARLEREAQVIGQLDHEHIVRVIDFLAPSEHSPVLVLEFIRGRTLADALADEGRFTPQRAVDVTRQVAQALSRAHQLGVLHRDIKPSNVLLTRVGERRDFVKVLDFGIARDATGLALTRSQTTLGTPHYMSPEQTRRQRLTPASDLYSLGCVLFELLSGRPPFDGSHAMVMYAHAQTPPPHLQDLAPGTPPPLVALVGRLLAKAPEDRFGDAHELILALDGLPIDFPQRPAPHASLPPPPVKTPPEQTLEQRLYDRFRLLSAVVSPATGREAQLALDALAKARADLTAADRAALTGRQQASEARARVGRALDALGRDASLEARNQRALQREVEQVAGARQAAVTAVCQTLADLDAAPAPTADAQEALERSARTLAGVEARRTAAEQALALSQQRTEDLQFQLDQLKGRLAVLQAEGRAHRDASQAQLSALHARHQAALEAAAAALDRLDELAASRGHERDT